MIYKGIFFVFAYQEDKKMRITIFNEFHPDQKKGKALKVYPNGIHSELKSIFADKPEFNVTLATQENPSHGLTDSVLKETDVLIWWSDIWNEQILSDVSDKVYSRILEGMGAIFLYGACNSKPFKRLMGTTCSITKISSSVTSKIYSVLPGSPICNNVKFPISFSEEKFLCEPFEIPTPDSLVLVNGYSSSDILRSGCAYYRGKGKILYFYGGSELSSSYTISSFKKIILNSVLWVAPTTIDLPLATNSEFKDTEKAKKGFFFKK